MVLLPFLKYLKPFRLRIAFSVLCMFMVSLFGMFNLLLALPFLSVILGQSESIDLKKLNPMTSTTTVERPQDVESTDAEPKAPEDMDATDFLSDDAKGVISRIEAPFARWWKAKRAWLDERRARANLWFTERAQADPFGMLILLCSVLLVMTAIKCLAEWGSNLNLAHVFYHMTLRMREDLYRVVMNQDYLFFTKKSPGYLISRINSDVSSIRVILNKLMLDGIQQPLNLMMAFFGLLIVSWRLTLVTMILLPPIALMIYQFAKILRKNTRKQKKKADELSHGLAEALHNIRLVKVFGTEDYEIDRYVKRSQRLFYYMMKRRIAKFASGPIMEFIGTVGACGIMLLGGWLILGRGTLMGGSLSFMQFTVFLMFLSRFYRPLKSLSATTLRYQTAKVSAERILEMMALKPEVVEAPDARPFDRLESSVQLRDVTLRYDRKEILKGVSLCIPKGKVVALVGRSGSGKTSIANLVARLIDPNEGQILVDGIDLRQYKMADLRHKMGIVTQQTILFDDSIENNIIYGSSANGLEPDARRERVIEAARSANADEFILNLDGGRDYATRIGPDGMKLSGGQSQRIAIARALYRDPQIMIFDEATSALDNQSQAIVQKAINAVLRHRTALVISHRLSTIRDADTIYVLDDGRIVEQGTHEELMARRGVYYALYQAEEMETIA